MKVLQEYYLARTKGELKRYTMGPCVGSHRPCETGGKMRDGVEALLQKWVVDGMERLYGVNYPGLSTPRIGENRLRA